MDADLRYFDAIIPCGINDKDVTTMSKELKRKVEMKEVVSPLLHSLSRVFQVEVEVQSVNPTNLSVDEMLK